MTYASKQMGNFLLRLHLPPPASAKFCLFLTNSAIPPLLGGGGEGEIPHKCASIGHCTLWGRCPAPFFNLYHKPLQQGAGTADHLMLLRLFCWSPLWAADLCFHECAPSLPRLRRRYSYLF